jgi:hypothetical protein
MDNLSVKVTVHPNGDDFTIIIELVGSESTATFTTRQHVVEDTLKAIAEATTGELELVAPDWLKFELEKEGYNF